MKLSTLPPDESERLSALLSYRILDTLTEDAFDSITELAAHVCDVPIALINFVDKDRQWFKSARGLTGVKETPRDTGFCAHAILDSSLMEVPDATADERFFDNPFVVGEPGIRFYAGMPLVDSAGYKLGTLCLIDRHKRQLTQEQKTSLHQLSQLVISLLEKRRNAITGVLHLGSILDLSFDEIYIIDPVSSRFVYANSRACNNLQRTSTEIQDLSPVDIDLDVDAAQFQDLLAPLLDGETRKVEFETRHTRKDGTTYPVETRLQAVEVGGEQFAIAIVRDISPQKQAEAIASRTEARYRKLVERSPDIIFIHREGRFTFINPAGIRLLGGTSAEQFLGHAVRDFVHPDYHAIANARIRQIMQTGLEVEPIEEVFIKLDGSTITLEVAATAMNEDGASSIQVVARDITERKRAMEAIRHAENRYRGIFENAAEGIFQISPDGKFLAANPALAKMYGYSSPADLIAASTNIRQLMIVDPDQHLEFMHAMSEVGKVTSFEVMSHRNNGDAIWINLNVRTVKDEDGVLLYYEGSALEITQNKTYQQELEHQANHDTLTGLPNRNLLSDRLTQALAQAQRYGREVVIAFIDLDNFKFINDSLGHKAGDELLNVIAHRLQDCIRDTDTAARVGGDEFVLILSDQVDEESTTLLLHRVLDRVSRSVSLAGTSVEVSCSIGASVYPQDGTDAETLLKFADIAMYRAKEQGRSNIQFFMNEMTARMRERVLIESRLRGALARSEFVIHYQPQIDLRSGKITSLEALVRWQNESLGLVPPSRFINLAEETGIIVALGEWVLRTACMQLKTWQRAGFENLTISVNLSTRQFRQKNLVELVTQVLQETGLSPQSLELELTESMMMQNIDEAIMVLHELKAMGVKISVDDFGTGYSSLSYLKRLPIDALKIDRAFVMDIDKDANDALIVKAMIALAAGLQLRVIAEGVETNSQLSFLLDQQADVVQGFLISEPLTAIEVERLIAHNQSSHPQLFPSIRRLLPESNRVVNMHSVPR
ncbi:MAG: EAL domain-containing protein [Betaproteobacteria bacterium]|nr:EAL domain-containing protein [Betaproteobacteria bacterium]